jgi:hypothetical protein
MRRIEMAFRRSVELSEEIAFIGNRNGQAQKVGALDLLSEFGSRTERAIRIPHRRSGMNEE